MSGYLLSNCSYLFILGSACHSVKKRVSFLVVSVLLFSALLCSTTSAAIDRDDYLVYNQTVCEAEGLIASQRYTEALAVYRDLFNAYDFIFLRDYKIATQLALHMGHTDEAFALMKKGIASGWTWKSIRKNKFLNTMRSFDQWTTVNQQYDSLRGSYRARLNPETRAVVRKMFEKDQRKALGALFVLGSKARNRYIEKRFAPQSEKQVTQLNQLISTQGYPGERLIGNNFWAETMLSHHNSMTVQRTLNDTLYPIIRPKLLQAIRAGQMSPYEFALIDDWYITIKSDHTENAYGYLASLTEAEHARANELRSKIGLRSVETRNRLIAIQQQTGMNFYLPSRPQPNGVI